MNEEQAFDILQRIAAAYTQFDLTGSIGEKRIEVWVKQLTPMPYERVLFNLDEHMAKNKFPPTIAEIAAQPKQENTHFENIRQWERAVAEARKAGHTKTFVDFLPEKLRHKYNKLLKDE
ncbi:replicative helicase loader/inhibitor [Bacillus tianshenii]|nr:replicative helicase loader/inhibitor [Bacillus tianshenii]